MFFQAGVVTSPLPGKQPQEALHWSWSQLELPGVHAPRAAAFAVGPALGAEGHSLVELWLRHEFWRMCAPHFSSFFLVVGLDCWLEGGVLGAIAGGHAVEDQRQKAMCSVASVPTKGLLREDPPGRHCSAWGLSARKQACLFWVGMLKICPPGSCSVAP